MTNVLHRAAHEQALASLIRRSDYWRRSPAAFGGPHGHKEWVHFCVLSSELDLLVNLSLMDERHGPQPAVEVPRLTLLARGRDGRWQGDSVRIASARVRGGGLAASFGASTLDFQDGAYRLEVSLPRGDVAASLRLAPCARPALTSSVGLGRGASMKWLVVPRLVADGAVRLGGRRIPIVAAPAYHDHDWGGFDWGGDFAWEWAIVLAERAGVPWTFIIQRITDRARTRTLSQGMLVWRAARHLCTLHGSDLMLRGSGRTRAAGALRVPRPMALAYPGAAADLPQRLECQARSGDDHVEACLEIRDLAQLAIPDDVGLGATLVSEAHATAQLAGRLAGERISLEAPALVEFNRAAA